jgi:anti-anti-sigma factor
MARDTLQIVTSAGSKPGQTILTLKGSLNIQTIFDFQKATREEGAPKLILDFSGVPYVDSAGLGALVGVMWRRSARSGNWRWQERIRRCGH